MFSNRVEPTQKSPPGAKNYQPPLAKSETIQPKKLTPEEKDKLSRKVKFKGVIDPESLFMKSWEVAHVTLVLYIALVHTFKVSFLLATDYPVWGRADLAIDVYFLLDMIINFFVPYMDSNYVYITSKPKIAMNYLMSSWFYIDVLSIMPMNYFLDERHSWNKYIRLSKAPRLYKILKMTKLMRTMRKKNRWLLRRFFSFFQKGGYDIIINNIPFFIIIVMVSHVLACIWHFFNSGISEPDSWITSNGFNEEATADRYVSVMYFVYTTMTTTGYGDLTPNTISERLMGLGMMSIGVIIFAYIFQKMLDEMQERHTKSNIIDDKSHELKILKRQIQLNRLLTVKIQKVIRSGPIEKHWAPEYTDSDIKGIDKVIVEDFDFIFRDFSFFDSFNDEMKVRFYRNMERNKYSAKKFIYRESLPADKIYFILSGEIHFCFQFSVDQKLEFFEYVQLKKGSVFGAIEALLSSDVIDEIALDYRSRAPNKTNGISLNLASVFCVQDTVCYEMNRGKLIDLLEISNKSKRIVKEMLKLKLKRYELARASTIELCKDTVEEIELEEQKKQQEYREEMLKNQQKVFGAALAETIHKRSNPFMYSRKSFFQFEGLNNRIKRKKFIRKQLEKVNEEENVVFASSGTSLAKIQQPSSSITKTSSAMNIKSNFSHRGSVLSNGLSAFRGLEGNGKNQVVKKLKKDVNNKKIKIMSPDQNSISRNEYNLDSLEMIDTPQSQIQNKSRHRGSILSPFSVVKKKKNSRRQKRIQKRKKVPTGNLVMGSDEFFEGNDSPLLKLNVVDSTKNEGRRARRKEKKKDKLKRKKGIRDFDGGKDKEENL